MSTVWRGIPEVYRIVVYSIAIVMKRSIRIRKSWKTDYFHIQRKYVSPDKLVHQMAPHLSYHHANLDHVIVAEVVKHSRPVLVVDIKRT